MLRIRVFEEALYRLFMSGTMTGTIHQSIGQEAVSAGVGAAMRPDDLMSSGHRGHGHAIAKGLPMRELMAEMFGRQSGSSAGMGGSMHIFDLSRGFLGTTGVVGAGVPIADGAALAVQLEGSNRVVVSFFGEGAANQGAVHEALNLAAIWRLPVVFVCENNLYAVSMPAEQALAVPNVADRAGGYGMPGRVVDGQDAFAIIDAAREAIDRARRGDGPSLVECMTYRFKGHSRFEPAAYRPPGELDEWLGRDPIESLRNVLVGEGALSQEEAVTLQLEVDGEVQEAIEFARSSRLAEASVVPGLVFAS